MEQKQEIPTGDVDGINNTFTLSCTPLADSLNFFKNGELQYPELSYDLCGKKIITKTPLAIGDEPYATYTF